MAEHWSWLTGCAGAEAAEYTYSPPTRPSRPPHRPLVKVATSAHLHTIARVQRCRCVFQSVQHSAPADSLMDDCCSEENINLNRLRVYLSMALGSLSLFVVVLTALSASVDGTAEVMSHVMAHYGKSLEECRKETGLSPDIMEEFQHFWRDDFEVVHRELGCTIICMSNKFSLLKDDNRIHHLSMNDYIKSFPQGEILSERMVEMIHNCEKQYDDIADDCDRVVKAAACFKVQAKKEGIAPEVAMIEAVMEQY